MKKINEYIENYNAPSAGYPYGRFRNDPGDGTGSEAVSDTINDLMHAIYAVVEAHKAGGVSGDAETTVASDLLDAIDALDDTNVKLSGAQTVADIKTFSSIPVLPEANPTTINEATRKAYVDEQVNSVPPRPRGPNKFTQVLSAGGAYNLNTRRTYQFFKDVSAWSGTSNHTLIDLEFYDSGGLIHTVALTDVTPMMVIFVGEQTVLIRNKDTSGSITIEAWQWF